MIKKKGKKNEQKMHQNLKPRSGLAKLKPSFELNTFRFKLAVVSPHTPVPPYLVHFCRLFSLFLSQSTAKFPSKHGPKSTYFLALRPNRVKTCSWQGAPSGALRGRLRRGPLTNREGGRGSRLLQDQYTVRVQYTGI